MTRRYTGAEARELAAKATSEALEVGHGFEGAYVLNKNREHPFYAHCVGARAVERAALLAAAPDLAESLAAVEAERDALRAAARTCLRLYEAGWSFIEREACFAALREAAK